MFKNAYETTPCSAYALAGIVAALKVAMVEGQLQPVQSSRNIPVTGLFEVPPYLKAVGPFSHTIALEHFGKKIYVIDTRPFTRGTENGAMRVVNPTEYKFAVLRGMLTQQWAEGHVSDLATFGDVAPRAFIKLLSEGITRRLGLSPLDQQALVAVTGFYYYCQFEVEEQLTERDFTKLVMRISRNTAVPAEKVIELLDGQPKIVDIHGYVQTMKQVVRSTRLEQLNPGLIYSIIGGSWYGAAAREIVAVSLEHPPTYLAMVYMALTDRSYHTAYFTKLVEMVNKGPNGKEFLANFSAFLEASLNV